MAIRVVGLGAGGHAKGIIEILNLDYSYEVIGLLDPKPELKGQSVMGVPVLGDDSIIHNLSLEGVEHFFIGLGSNADSSPRRRLYDLGLAQGMKSVSVFHPRSIISPSVQIGDGATILAGAIVNALAVLGNNNIVNSGSIVEHDCILSDDVHVATGAKLCGSVYIGNGVHVGAGATIKQGVKIMEKSIVGAGAVVVNDVSAYSTVVGIPARPLPKE